MKYSTEEWINLWVAWKDATERFESARKERERLFAKAKTWLGCSNEFGNLSAIPEMIEREVGRAVIEERP